MSGSIKRINTCANCVNMDPTREADGSTKLICRLNPPVGHPIIAIVRGKGKPAAPEPRLLGTIAVWAQVMPDQWCAQHRAVAIERATDIPKQMQVFGVGR